MPELPILTYHRIGATRTGPEGISVPLSEFTTQMDLLAERGFTGLTLETFLGRLFEGRKKKGRYTLITFDDGYEEVFSLAWPILRERGLTATVFVTTGSIGKTNFWDEAGGQLDLLSRAQILELSRSGWDFGSHTHNHPHLDTLGEDRARDDIGRSKRLLEEILGKPVLSFCYPYGECSEASKQLVRSQGFACAFASDSGPSYFHEDPFEIRRIVIFPGLTRAGFLRKISGFYHRYRKLTGR